MNSSQFLIRFVQQHPTFRRTELEACAIASNCNVSLPLKLLEYNDSNPVAVLELPDAKTAAQLIDRSILAQYPYLMFRKY